MYLSSRQWIRLVLVWVQHRAVLFLVARAINVVGKSSTTCNNFSVRDSNGTPLSLYPVFSTAAHGISGCWLVDGADAIGAVARAFWQSLTVLATLRWTWVWKLDIFADNWCLLITETSYPHIESSGGFLCSADRVALGSCCDNLALRLRQQTRLLGGLPLLALLLPQLRHPRFT